MTKKEQLEIERQRRETALKNTFFNRYLLLRYTIALFFFGNIYWLLNQFIRPSFVIVLPITLIVLAILATVEQFRLYGKRDERLKVTQMFVRSQAVIQVGLLVLTWTSLFTTLFPIFENNQAARFFVFVILLLGLGLCLLNLKRIQEICERKDKAYQRFIEIYIIIIKEVRLWINKTDYLVSLKIMSWDQWENLPSLKLYVQSRQQVWQLYHLLLLGQCSWYLVFCHKLSHSGQL